MCLKKGCFWQETKGTGFSTLRVWKSEGPECEKLLDLSKMGRDSVPVCQHSLPCWSPASAPDSSSTAVGGKGAKGEKRRFSCENPGVFLDLGPQHPPILPWPACLFNQVPGIQGEVGRQVQFTLQDLINGLLPVLCRKWGLQGSEGEDGGLWDEER